jgi:UDP-2,3-diacylglucosamine pyrophosphatase LpxH
VSELVLNGDIIDFLQIAPFRRGPYREAIGKVQRAAHAHREAIEALGRFVGAGNRLVILPGDHDIELAFWEVQAAFTALVSGGDAGAASRVVFPNDAPLGPHFQGCPRGPFAYRLPGVYVEHGNQLDRWSAFNYQDLLEDRVEGRIRLPPTSQWSLDLFNELEPRYPFIDKVRPRSAALLLLWLLDPALARSRLPALAALGRRLYPELKRRGREAPGAAFDGAKGSVDRRDQPAGRGATAHPAALEEELLSWLGAYAEELRILDEACVVLQAADAQGSKGEELWNEKISAAYTSVFQAALAGMSSPRAGLASEDAYAARALELAHAERAEVVVLGHSHGLRDIRMGWARYLNTGTWIGLVGLDDLRQAAQAEALRAQLSALRRRGALEFEQRLSFVEIAYPNGQLDAGLRVFRGGRAHAANTATA